MDPLVAKEALSGIPEEESLILMTMDMLSNLMPEAESADPCSRGGRGRIELYTGNNADGDGVDGEEQVEASLEEQVEHQAVTQVEEQEPDQIEDSNLEREHGEETTSMMVEDRVQIIILPIQVQIQLYSYHIKLPRSSRILRTPCGPL